MKRLFLTMLGAALLAVPSLRAQSLDGVGLTVEKVNVDKLIKSIEKSDAEIADPKKGVKATTWVKRGDVFLDVYGKPINSLYSGLEEAMLVSSFGDATVEQVDLGGVVYSVYTFEHFKGYVKDAKLEFYVPITVIDDKALDKAYDAFAKAYEIDMKSQKKVGAGMKNVQNRSLEAAVAYYSLKEIKPSADNFRRAYKASAHPSVNEPDTISLYNAGLFGTIAGDSENALNDLNKALELGYEAEGETYYYKFHSLYQLGRTDEAVETLEYAITKYPNDDNIIAALLELYSNDPEKDPTNLIPLVLNVIEQNPNNPDLYVGLARVYDKLNQRENSIAAALKGTEVDPNNFLAYHYAGYYLAKKGDDKDSELREMTITSRAQYQQALADVNAAYADAVPPLERAHEIDPKEPRTVELLKNLTFRLREEPGMNEKYEKYNEMYKAQHGEE